MTGRRGRQVVLNALFCFGLLFSTYAEGLAQQAGSETREIERPGRTGLPLPRFASFRSDEVNLRTGPGVRYPIEWVYRRQGLPVEIVDEFETWRRVRDWEGTLGWVHQSMLSGRRTLRVQGDQVALRREPSESAALVAWLEGGVIGELKGCDGGWCRAEVAGYDGWLMRSDFYGTLPREDLQ
ncbi:MULTISPECIES: SH3 domain-containing protein [Limibacillus]|jgi:SH3-like domain-containing protein|uniref:SH3-like domain-containing protein n=1 Tax=Limibacillus halophilus TaxID=1579333 RepID=A0A839SYG9_9PROT|nr:SH3 domain-containing protein [Limibacillus halophilus]MBB3066606.1 SH3-like domain-containing protein [Limibacillus halophilus]